jgi:uncharacterized protein (UPF0332 family)
MQDAKKHLKWCLKQNKGIKIVKPSENLTTAYLRKSRNALKSMEVNAEADITEWAISASYYAKYFAVYALLAKIGAKSEIVNLDFEVAIEAGKIDVEMKKKEKSWDS